MYKHYLHPVSQLPESAEFMRHKYTCYRLLCIWQTVEKYAHLPLHHWNGCMKFDSQGSSSVFKPCQEKAGEEPSLWAGALDTGSVWSPDSGTQDFSDSWIALLLCRVGSSKNNH